MTAIVDIHAREILDSRGNPTVEVDVVSHYSRPGDRVLLCSDGLSDLVDDDCLAACLASEPAPERAVNTLMELANQAGGKDNIAALVAEIH